MKRRLVGLMLVVVLCFGFAPSALAHKGDHDVWEACRLAGSGLAFIVTTIVTRKVAAPANLSPAATTGIQAATTVAAAGNAGGFYHRYGSHAVEVAVNARVAVINANSNPKTPNFLYGAMR